MGRHQGSGKPLVVPFGSPRLRRGDEKPKANEEQCGEGAGFCCQAPAGPALRCYPKGLRFGIASRLRGQRHRSTVVVGNCDHGPITVVPHRAKAGLFGRSSILFRPHPPATNGVLVEPPGTAPGSEPIITGAFIAIVGVAPDSGQYRGQGRGAQGGRATRGQVFGAWKIKGLDLGVRELEKGSVVGFRAGYASFAGGVRVSGGGGGWVLGWHLPQD